MEGKKNIRINFPASEKVYIPGEMNRIHVGVRRIILSDTRITDGSGLKSRKKNNPVILYDTTGPYSDPNIAFDPQKGIPRIKEEWNIRRKNQIVRNNRLIAKEKKNITQLFYAKRRVITPEMEYVAIRENQQIEELGLKSYITPDFVRKEIAAGRAIIPSNINHPEAEPMIIGKSFLVKVASLFTPEQGGVMPEKESDKIAWHCKWGSDMLVESGCGHLPETRELILRNSPVPYCSVPLFQALSKVEKVEELTWELYRETLISQAEQGVDCVVIHAGFLKKHIDLTSTRLIEMAGQAGAILRDWMKRNNKENFLHIHFAEICEILKRYDVTLLLGNALHPGSIYDSNDSAQFSELRVIGELTKKAKDHFIQVIVENSGHTPLNKIQEYSNEQQYICNQAPSLAVTPVSTDIVPKHDTIASAIGAAHMAWLGVSLIADLTPCREKPLIKEKIIAHKIAAHSADLAKGHPGSQVRDNALSKALFEGRTKDACNLSSDPTKAVRNTKREL